jgi:hypothetical protein
MFANLNQGKELLEYEVDVEKKVQPHLKLIEETSSPELGSLMEGLKGEAHTNTKIIEGLSDIEDEFNKTLVDYNNTYKLFSEDLLNKNQSKKKVVGYLGKVISDEEGNKKYVNDFGFTHMYNQYSWENNNSSCPQSTVNMDGTMAKELQIGPIMGAGQPCKIAGKNIKNKDTGEEAWVDIRGYKHIYSDSEKSTSCRKQQPLEINNNEYNAIPTGGNMTSTKDCNTLDVNPDLWNKMMKLNKKLSDLAQNIVTEMKKLKVQDKRLQTTIKNKREKAMVYINNLQTDKNDLIYNRRMMMTVAGEEEDSELQRRSYFYKFIIYLVFMIVIVLLTSHLIANKSQDVSIIVYLIAGIFAIMFLVYIFRVISNMKVTF